MEQLTTLEKEFFKEIHGREARMDGSEDVYFMDEAKAAAALCERKMREAWDEGYNYRCIWNKIRKGEYHRLLCCQDIQAYPRYTMDARRINSKH